MAIYRGSAASEYTFAHINLLYAKDFTVPQQAIENEIVVA